MVSALCASAAAPSNPKSRMACMTCFFISSPQRARFRESSPEPDRSPQEASHLKQLQQLFAERLISNLLLSRWETSVTPITDDAAKSIVATITLIMAFRALLRVAQRNFV